MKRKTKSTKSSGNVFADLGLPNADEHLIKADIVIAIAERIKTKRLTQAEVSKLIGLAQPDVSKLLRGHFIGYSYERLFGFLNALGDNVKIAVSPAKTKKQARVQLELT
jgi:predicted XRE-type DNA-binding protein